MSFSHNCLNHSYLSGRRRRRGREKKVKVRWTVARTSSSRGSRLQATFVSVQTNIGGGFVQKSIVTRGKVGRGASREDNALVLHRISSRDKVNVESLDASKGSPTWAGGRKPYGVRVVRFQTTALETPQDSKSNYFWTVQQVRLPPRDFKHHVVSPGCEPEAACIAKTSLLYAELTRLITRSFVSKQKIVQYTLVSWKRGLKQLN